MSVGLVSREEIQRGMRGKGSNDGGEASRRPMKSESLTPPRQPSEGKDCYVPPLQISRMPCLVEDENSSPSDTHSVRCSEENVDSGIFKKCQRQRPAVKTSAWSRVESFIGKKEGFEICEQYLSPIESTGAHAQSRMEVQALDATEASELPDFCEIDYQMDIEDSTSSQESSDKEYLLKVDFSTDTYDQGDLLLGALPVIPGSPSLCNAESFWERMDQVHVYTKCERNELIRKYRNKVPYPSSLLY